MSVSGKHRLWGVSGLARSKGAVCQAALPLIQGLGRVVLCDASVFLTREIAYNMLAWKYILSNGITLGIV
jgi:hypothetical protein